MAIPIYKLLLKFLPIVLYTSDVASPTLLSNATRSLIYTLQRRYCGEQFCSQDPSYQPLVCPQTNQHQCSPCSKCSCEESCRLYGNCCADKFIGAEYRTNCENVENYQTGGTLGSRYLIVTECPRDAPKFSTDLAWKCGHGKLGEVQDGRLVTALHRYNTSVTFRNKYCALCYNITNYTSWDVYISCRDDFDFSNYSDINSVIQAAKRSNFCVVAFKPPPRDQLPPGCPMFFKDFISTCNVTGRWQEYNDSIKTACEAYFNPTWKWKYKNIFCSLCNGDSHNELLCPNCFGSLHKPVVMRSFAALLNFEKSDVDIIKSERSSQTYQIRRIGKQDAHQCRKGDLFDELSRVCREVYCALVEENNTSDCVKLVASEHHVMTLWNATAYYTTEIISSPRILNPSLGAAVIDHFEPLMKEIGFFIYRVVTNDFARIHSPEDIIVTDSQLELKLLLLPGFSLESSRNKLRENLSLNVSSFLGQLDVNIVSGNSNATGKLLTHTVEIQSNPSDVTKIEISQTVHVPLVFNVSCPFVRFVGHEVDMVNNSVTIQGFNVLNEDEYFVSEFGEYFICLHAFQREIYDVTEAATHVRSDDIATAPIVTAVCLSFSLFFLLITMLVYTSISELHTVPGLNLLFLAASLFSAQIFFLFGAGTVTTPAICTVIAVFIHFFWLVALAWMNVCSLHVFRVFSNTLGSRDLGTSKTFLMLKYSSFAYGVAMLIVVTTITTTYITSGYTSIAYGGPSLCFVAAGLVSVVSFGIPVGVTVVVNAVLLTFTTLNLRKASERSRYLGKSEATDISKFLKLSTLTGLSWIFGFLGYFFQRVELLYTFTILTAGQGVLIFFSFVASKRILNMVKDKLCCVHRKKANLTDSNSGSKATVSSVT